jgi:uridine kinase
MHEMFVEPARTTADAVLDWRQTSASQAKVILQRIRERLDDEPLIVSG